MKKITKINKLEAKGFYSLAVSDENNIYISGQLPTDQKTGELLLGSAEEETRLILNNIQDILKQYGCDKNHILKTTVFMSDPSYWEEVNKVYSEFFVDHQPARAAIPVKESPDLGFKIEIEAIASLKKLI